MRKFGTPPVSRTELDLVLSDKEWWEEKLPPGWKLHGWTDQEQASVLSPGGRRLVQLDGEFLAAMHAKTKEFTHGERKEAPHPKDPSPLPAEQRSPS